MDAAKVMAKLRKLIAHQTSAEKIGSLAEAEAFAAKVQALMIEHRIQEVPLFEEQNPFAVDQVDMGGALPGRWMAIVVNLIAEHNGASSLWIHSSDSVVICGREDARQVTVLVSQVLLRWLRKRVLRDANLALGGLDGPGVEDYCDSYMVGFAGRLKQRLERSKAKSANHRGAIVLYSEAQKAAEMLRGQFKPESEAVGAKRTSIGYHHGVEAAKRAPAKLKKGKGLPAATQEVQ